MTPNTTSMRRIGIRRVLRKKAWSDRFAGDRGIARCRISQRRRAGAVDSRYRPMAQAFAVRAGRRARPSRNRRTTCSSMSTKGSGPPRFRFDEDCPLTAKPAAIDKEELSWQESCCHSQTYPYEELKKSLHYAGNNPRLSASFSAMNNLQRLPVA